jgi:hypothetical protein
MIDSFGGYFVFEYFQLQLWLAKKFTVFNSASCNLTLQWDRQILIISAVIVLSGLSNQGKKTTYFQKNESRCDFNFHGSVLRKNSLMYIQQDATLHSSSGKLLYMFRVVPPPIIRSANSCIYGIWYLSQRYCYLPLSWKSLTNNRGRRYSCLRSWWWVVAPPETCRAFLQINCVTLHLLWYTLE